MRFSRIFTLSASLMITFYSMISASYLQAATFVSTQEASQLLINPARSSPAVVVSLNQGNIPAQTSGVMKTLLARVGDSFTKGETIASVDCTDNTLRFQTENAKLSQANTQWLLTKRELIRGEKLVKQNNIGEAELDQLASAVKTANSLLTAQQAVLDMAKLNVERCNIKAPYTGIVTKRIASVGEMIEYGKPVIEMVDVASLEVSAKIANSDQASFNEAESFVLDTDGKQHEVVLRALLPVIESNSRSREARFVFSNSQGLVGSTGRVRWQSPKQYLPAHLLQKRNGHNGYFIVENNAGSAKAKFIIVNSAEEGRPIIFNKTAETIIVTDGHHGLNEGDEVELIKQHSSSQGESL